MSRLATKIIQRLIGTSSMSTCATQHALVYERVGSPEAVLSISDLPSAPPKHEEMTLRFILSPINPSDINTIEGKYPLQPPLPGVPGHEGLAEVLALGSKVQGLSVGDWVVPLVPCTGTWRQQGTFLASNFHQIPKDIPVEAAATLCINPPSALAMLENFVRLQPGDVVIQNGATSAVGRAVIQLAKGMGVKTVNIIRERPNWEDTVQQLRGIGADVVTTDTKAKEDMSVAGLPAAALGLNCIGGSSVVTIAKLLRDSGTVVTYGGMSMKPVSVPTSLLIFKDIRFKGFWLSGRSSQEQGRSRKIEVLDRLVQLIRENKLTTGPTKIFPMDQYKEALAYYALDRRPAKVLLEMTPR